MSKNTMVQSTFDTTFNSFTPDVFRDPMFGELRVFIDSQSHVWFIGTEVAQKLGYKDSWDALNRHVPNTYKQVIHYQQLTGETPVNPGNPNILLIHELGLYALATKSNLPTAQPFQEWVYKTIQNMRMYGVSMSPQLKTVMEIDEEQLWRIAQQREEENKRLRQSAMNIYKEADKFANEANFRGQVANERQEIIKNLKAELYRKNALLSVYEDMIDDIKDIINNKK